MYVDRGMLIGASIPGEACKFGSAARQVIQVSAPAFAGGV
jgi:hypothetical protein